jgi:hypothetical protein
MHSKKEQPSAQSLETLPMTKDAFMAKWNKLSPRAQRELLDLARERHEVGNEEEPCRPQGQAK